MIPLLSHPSRNSFYFPIPQAVGQGLIAESHLTFCHCSFWGAGGHLGCKVMFTVQLQLGGHHNPHVLHCQAALQPVLVPGGILPHGQDSACSPSEICVIPICLFWTKMSL